jgi:hypothetical protein
MNIKGLLLWVFLFISGLIKAQNDFRPGYVIKNNGDTLYGAIDYQDDFLMGSICRFKSNEHDIITLYPNDIFAYRFIDSRFYVSREINGKKVFLEYLINGIVNVYYLRDKNYLLDEQCDHYYLEKENVPLTEIPYEEGIKYIDDTPFFYKSSKYIGFLYYYMQDAPDFHARISRLKKLEHRDLIKLAEDYHNAVCKGEKCIIYEKKSPFIKLSIEPFWGLTRYNGYNKFINELGSYIYICAARTNEMVYVKTGIIYHKISEEGDHLKIYKIPLQIQYLYSSYRFMPKASFGFNFLTIKLDEYKNIGHTLSLNVGFNYKINKSISLSTGFNSDYTPLSRVMMERDFKFSIISYSFNAGLYIEL